MKEMEEWAKSMNKKKVINPVTTTPVSNKVIESKPVMSVEVKETEQQPKASSSFASEFSFTKKVMFLKKLLSNN
jgi:hypothetical protein